MYEHHRKPLIPRRAFGWRIARHVLGASGLGLAALWVGMAGYHWVEGLSWLDAYSSAAMILGGMGPATELKTSAGELFAGSYALFACIVFVVGAGVVLAPVAHRAMHRFHLDDER